MGNLQDGQYLRPSDPAYEQVLDSLAMVARHTPVPLLEALLRWRERWAFPTPLLIMFSYFSINSYFVCMYHVLSFRNLSPTLPMSLMYAC